MKKLLITCFVVFVVPPAGADTLDVNALRDTLREASATDNGPVLVEAASALRTQFPGHPTYSYLLARGHVLMGDATAAAETLRELTARGVDMLAPLNNDDAFDTMRELPAFTELEQQAALLEQPAGNAERAWRFGPADTIPEAVAIDARGHVFVSSVYRREILVRDVDGKVRHWRDPALWSVQGLRLSTDGAILWAATSAMNVTPGTDSETNGRSALVAFDANTGKRIARHVLELEGEHVLGDFIFLDDTTLLATDSIGGGVYALDTTSGRYTERVAPGTLRSPQGLARVGDSIFIADYGNGLYRFVPGNDQLEKVADGPAAPYGIDGLYAYNGALIAIQNGVRPQQVARFTLSADGTRIAARETLLMRHPDFDEPTLGTIHGDHLYLVANSQWNRFTADGSLRTENLAPPVILSLALLKPPTQ